MPLIFIHGVTVRSGVENNKDKLVRDALFRRLIFPSLFSDPSNVEILNPCWGDKAAKFYWNYASLPTGNEETFGTEDELAGLILGTFLGEAAPSTSTVLLGVARHSMQDVIDLLWVVSSTQIDNAQKADEFAQFAVHASNYIRRYPHPAWLEDLRNDEEFLNQFTYEIQHYQETLSDRLVNTGSGLLQQGRAHLQNLVRQFGQRASDVFVNTSRQSLHKKFALFLGDIFVYLADRGTPEKPGEIVTTLLAPLDQAVQRQREAAGDSKLIIVAHSMGGNIIYDILTAFRPNVNVDVLVTVGSQVAVFEELKLFQLSNKDIPNAVIHAVDKPANVKHWLNVFDKDDVLGFATQKVFADTADFSFNTEGGVISSHSKYFTMPSFHQRLCERIKEVLT